MYGHIIIIECGFPSKNDSLQRLIQRGRSAIVCAQYACCSVLAQIAILLNTSPEIPHTSRNVLQFAAMPLVYLPLKSLRQLTPFVGASRSTYEIREAGFLWLNCSACPHAPPQVQTGPLGLPFSAVACLVVSPTTDRYTIRNTYTYEGNRAHTGILSLTSASVPLA